MISYTIQRRQRKEKKKKRIAFNGSFHFMSVKCEMYVILKFLLVKRNVKRNHICQEIENLFMSSSSVRHWLTVYSVQAVHYSPLRLLLEMNKHKTQTDHIHPNVPYVTFIFHFNIRQTKLNWTELNLTELNWTEKKVKFKSGYKTCST